MVSMVVTYLSIASVLLGTFSQPYFFAASFVTNFDGCFSRESIITNRNYRAFSPSLKLSSVNADMECPPLPPIPPTKKRLFLVRHGEVINPGGDRPVYYGAMDVPLSKLGELEAKAAGQYLERFDLQHVAASPLSRAIFGGNEVLVRQKGVMVTDGLKIFKGFKEMDRGSWAMKTLAEIGADNMARFDACDESATPDGAESYNTLRKRVLAARDELLEMTDNGKASAIVSHLQVTRSMLGNALGVEAAEMVALKVATASVTCIDYDSDSGEQTVHFQSFKPETDLAKSVDGAN